MSTMRRLDKPIIAPNFDLQYKQVLVLSNGKRIHYLKSEIRECPEHKKPNVYVKIHHSEEDGTYHGYKLIRLCGSCSSLIPN